MEPVYGPETGGKGITNLICESRQPRDNFIFIRCVRVWPYKSRKYGFIIATKPNYFIGAKFNYCEPILHCKHGLKYGDLLVIVITL